MNVHCRCLGQKLSPPHQLGTGAVWAVPTQHPGHLRHQDQPQPVSWCFHINHSTSPGLGPSRAARLLLQGVPSLSSHVCFASVWALGTCQSQPHLYTGRPYGTSASLLLLCTLEALSPHLLEDCPGEGLGSFTSKVLTVMQVTPVAAVPISLVAQT